MSTIGFIGTGNMGGAMIGGLIRSSLYEPADILVSDASSEARERIAGEHPGIVTTADNRVVARSADILVLAVKPQVYRPVIEEIAEEVRPDTVIVTIAAGLTLATVEAWFGRRVKIIRTMPNTPALVGAGSAALSPNDLVSDGEREEVLAIFRSLGEADVLPEKLMDAFTALCGSSPAWVFQFVESLADGAVLEGMPRDRALRMAAQAVMGSAKLLLETGRHPGEMKDMVCSPGGTTIEAVASLEKAGFRSAVIEAVRVCRAKAGRLAGD